MKKWKLYLVLIIVFALLFSSCSTKKNMSASTNITSADQLPTSSYTIPYDTRISEPPVSQNVKNNGDTFYGEYVYNDDISLEDGLTCSYDLNQLETFFQYADYNEAGLMYPETSVLSFSAVNDVFPVQIIRTDKYSVYKVNEGGYFYVFWIVEPNLNLTTTEPYVRFSAYLSGDKTEDVFLTLQPNVSTAEDVKRIDPSLEICLDRSYLCTYSYMNNDWVLEVRYSFSGSSYTNSDYNDYSDFIVSDMVFVRRVWIPSAYTSILPDDLP